MSETTQNVIFFDIGDTLGTPRFSPFPYHLEGLDVYPYVPDVLRQLRDRNLRIGIISNIGEDTPDNVKTVLQECQIYDFFDPELLIYGAKDSSEIFERAAGQASHANDPKQCLFVGEDSQERSYAMQAGWRVVPHPCLALEVLNGSHLRYIRVTVPSEESEKGWRQMMSRYSGIKPLDAAGQTKIKSRHIQNPDNTVATQALARDFQQIGGDSFTVSVYPFTHEGRLLNNVEAELRGSKSDELVLITAHLDSTAAFSDHFDPKSDIAPGRDDDGSGVAAVLAIAGVMKELATIKPPKRSIRFVLFNAEEHGLIGSKAYARGQAAIAAPIVAVYQLDMIGYNVNPPRSFEVHVGYWPSKDVQNRSVVLAQRLARLTEQISPELKPLQIYTSKGWSNRDPAEGRSDHASFHERGYAACLASEDFFAGPLLDSPPAEANPNYHMKTDTFVDAEYATDIARTVAAAAWVTANI